MITVKNLCKNYVEDGEITTKALDGVSFEIKDGEFVAIMGPSGSGKSTLLNILSYLDRPTSGDYVFNGKKIDELSDKELARVRNKQMGFIFQSFNLLGRSTVYENVEMPLLYEPDIHAGDRKKLVEKAVASVGLAEKLYSEAGKLSGGQKQRVAIARALVNDPKVIFADEPTGNLDSASGAQVMGILSDLHNAGHTVILVTHETYTSEFARRVIRLLDGKLVMDAPIVKRRDGIKDFLK
jgi:putative ABC transport system ATP-binding protein